jgi:hypothetical protein
MVGDIRRRLPSPAVEVMMPARSRLSAPDSTELTDCAFRPDPVVDGEGRSDYEIGPTELTVTIEGGPCTHVMRQLWSDGLGGVDSTCP